MSSVEPQETKRSDLRDIANAFKAQSKSLSSIESDTADSARAIEEISNTLMLLSGQLQPLEEVLAFASKIPDVIRTLATLTDGVTTLTERLNRYVDATAEQNGGIRARLTKLETERAER